MNVTIPPDLEKMVTEKIESGYYESADDVLRESLRLLEERDHAIDIGLQDIREKIAVGLDQARRGELLDGEEVFEELDRRADRQSANQ